MRRLAILLLLAGCGEATGAPDGSWEVRGLRPELAAECPRGCMGGDGALPPHAPATPGSQCFVESEWSPGSQSFVWREVCEADDPAGQITVTTRWGSANTFGDITPDAFSGGCQELRIPRGGTSVDEPISCQLWWSRAE